MGSTSSTFSATGFSGGNVIADDDNADIDAGDIIEVIDLDELVEGEGGGEEESGDEMDEEGGEDEAESSGAAEKLPEDNSMLTFSKHGSKSFLIFKTSLNFGLI